MAETVGLASGITTLASTVYSGLGILQSLLNDQECDSGISEPAISENVSQALNTCLKVFKELSLMVSEYQTPHEKTEVRAWQRAKWTFKEKEIGDVRLNLATCKATLNMAISMAN